MIEDFKYSKFYKKGKRVKFNNESLDFLRLIYKEYLKSFDGEKIALFEVEQHIKKNKWYKINGGRKVILNKLKEI